MPTKKVLVSVLEKVVVMGLRSSTALLRRVVVVVVVEVVDVVEGGG